MFDPVDPKQSFPDLEQGILSYWKEEHVFHRSMEQRKEGETFSFYDGPPFATGLPHYGHLLAGTIKDVIPRYQTMQGKFVQRRFGWDCHGLPIENLIEKEQNITNKREIEAIGVAKFNEMCRNSVQRYVKEWRNTVERSGRWVDMDWDYRTMDTSYMESIWWVFKQLWEKKLIYEGHKPMHICPRCVTPLSNFEVTTGYKEVTDLSAIVKFELVEEPGTYVLAWTTTPWTLPGNLFLAINSGIHYVKVQSEGARYILAKDLVESVFKEKEYEFETDVTHGWLLTKRYKPLFPYFIEEYGNTAFFIEEADFVTTDEGTGVVHIAPGFGEDDFRLGEEKGVPLLQHVTMEGKFVEAVADFAGMDVKPKDDPSKTDRKIVEWLEKEGKLFSKLSYKHTYPHCWRCDSPLLNYATSSWFVGVEDIKERMLANAAKTEWMPAHLKEGRFGKWLTGARDWAISRNRYWGTPLPIWRSGDCEEIEVIGGCDDLMAHQRIRFTKVSVVRHGESEGNLSGLYQGKEPGTDLTKNGQKQAKAAGRWLEPQNVSVIYCSPLARTRQTAEAIAKETGAKVIVDERLREVEFGEYEGKSIDFSDLALVKAKRAHKLQTNSPETIHHFAGMETWASSSGRIATFLKDILPKHRSEHVCVVTHGDLCKGAKHFFTQEDPVKISHQPYPGYAAPVSYFWDHERNATLDLHKEFVDDIAWWGNSKNIPTLTLVRHGETDWNAQGKVQGNIKEIPLNTKGREQAENLAKELNKNDYDVIVCSDLDRTVETAEILANALGMKIAERNHLFAERNFGDWNTQDEEAVRAQHPMVSEDIDFSFHHETGKGGESLSAFFKRAKEAYDYLLKTYPGKRVLLVTHGGMIRVLQTLRENLSSQEGGALEIKNCSTYEMPLGGLLRRIPEVLDCWFESGSMPYAQSHYPFEFTSEKKGPPGFPADFIAEGVDQTRLWFYTLMVLSTIVFDETPYKHVVVNGIVLAEDGRKMSKKLKNYPDPNELMEKYGADAMRFTLMKSPAVRAEDLRFSEKAVEEVLRSVILPLWHSYGFFVTYANAANFEPVATKKTSAHALDLYVRAEVQDLVNRMTTQLDAYDLSATCKELEETIDGLTNWYIRLSRRRFAGKGAIDTVEIPEEDTDSMRHDALTTLHEMLVTISQLLAPFCPFVAENMYLNLVPEEHGSVHLTNWPSYRELTKQETSLLRRNRLLRLIVSLGLNVRSEAKVKTRQPLAQATIAVPPALLEGTVLTEDDLRLLRSELNVKEVNMIDDPGALGSRIAQVNARKVGPRLGGRVQEVIAAGKRGEFEIKDDGSILILDETLSPDELTIVYQGREGENIAAQAGIVVSLDVRVSKELQQEGLARDVIRAIQKLRKDGGLSITDRITLKMTGADELLAQFGDVIAQETGAVFGESTGEPYVIELDDHAPITLFFHV